MLLRRFATRPRRMRIFFSDAFGWAALLPPRRTPSRSLTEVTCLKFDRLRRRIKRRRFSTGCSALPFVRERLFERRRLWFGRVCEFWRWRDADRPRTLVCEFERCNRFCLELVRVKLFRLRLADRARELARTVGCCRRNRARPRTPKRSVTLTLDAELLRRSFAFFNKSAFSLYDDVKIFGEYQRKVGIKNGLVVASVSATALFIYLELLLLQFLARSLSLSLSLCLSFSTYDFALRKLIRCECLRFNSF